MRAGLLMLGLVSTFSATVRADEPATIVDKAVRVTANSDVRLNRLASVVRTDRGTMFMPEGALLVERTAYLAPDRLLYDAVLNGGGARKPMVIGLNGQTGWKKDQGQVEELPRGQADAIRAGDAEVWDLITLRPVRRSGVTLKPAPETIVGGKSALGVTVVRPGRPEAQLYFAAESGLLVKVVTKIAWGGREAAREVELGGHRDFDGIKLPTRMSVSQDGKKIEEWSVQDYRFPDRLDDKLFTKPK
jgi:hypothetical protein